MKLYNRLAIVFICILLGISCSKDVAKTNNVVAGLQTLPGNWELRSFFGGTTAAMAGNYKPGNGRTAQFTNDEFWFAYPGYETYTGNYTLSSGINPETNTEMNAMILNKDSLLPRYFTIADDTLTLYTGVVAGDGTIEKFVRIANP